MEKIYMNDNKNNKQSFFKKFFNDKGSMLALVVIAVVGIFGLVAFGFNQISFAADDETISGLGDSFTSSQDAIMTIGETADATPGRFQVLGFKSADGIPVFCTEYNVDYNGNGVTYVKGSEIKDQGLIYLMSTFYLGWDDIIAGISAQNNLSTADEENIRAWITQTAMWTYLYKKEVASGITNGGNSNFAEKVPIVENVYYLYDSNGKDLLKITTGQSIYEYYGISELIDTALRIGENKAWLNIDKKSDSISITKDNKYYQTDLITVTENFDVLSNVVSFDKYSVDLSKAPEGTILVSEDGNVYQDVTNMSPTFKFYLRVPVEKVKDENKAFTITVKGYFNAYGANEYTSAGSQKVVDIKEIPYEIEKPLNIDINYTPPVEDTGMSAAQTIYFIGLIILLSGVGIIYANSKPQGNN